MTGDSFYVTFLDRQAAGMAMNSKRKILGTPRPAAFSVALVLWLIFSLALAFFAGFLVGHGGWPKNWPRPVVQLAPPAQTPAPAPAAVAKPAHHEPRLEQGEQKLEKILRQDLPKNGVVPQGGKK